MDDNERSVLICLTICISIIIAATGVTYHKTMEVKYATENGYHQEIVDGRNIWVKD